MRIFKTKVFTRLAHAEGVPDDSLRNAVDEAQQGLNAADLGGGVIKQRVARAGSGKSGGFRVILAFRSETRSVFLHLFAKNRQENISKSELESLREIAQLWLTADDKAIEKAKADGKLLEVEREKGSLKNEGRARTETVQADYP